MLTIMGVTLTAALRPSPVRTVLMRMIGSSLRVSVFLGLMSMVILLEIMTACVLVSERVRCVWIFLILYLFRWTVLEKYMAW